MPFSIGSKHGSLVPPDSHRSSEVFRSPVAGGKSVLGPAELKGINGFLAERNIGSLHPNDGPGYIFKPQERALKSSFSGRSSASEIHGRPAELPAGLSESAANQIAIATKERIAVCGTFRNAYAVEHEGNIVLLPLGEKIAKPVRETFGKEFVSKASDRLVDRSGRFLTSSKPGVAFDPGGACCVAPENVLRNRAAIARGELPPADLSPAQIHDIEQATRGAIRLSGPNQNSIALIRGDRYLQLSPLPKKKSVRFTEPELLHSQRNRCLKHVQRPEKAIDHERIGKWSAKAGEEAVERAKNDLFLRYVAVYGSKMETLPKALYNNRKNDASPAFPANEFPKGDPFAE